MKPWVRLGRATLPDGSWLELRQHDTEFVIAADGYDLMVSRVHESELEMVALACTNLADDALILVGGLGVQLMYRVFDEVKFSPGREKGNRVVMRLKRPPKEQPQ